ncbi:hypothetical protein A1Q1_05757 [Trichosporon asahii var. asahii CBS 2479]|uniref:Uncharacterized protein n=1 Tax=Trichosporon asahii var. asahii (strain ATCC 90039 / CBS 2479 / JCM 2466 / KCTC 7840 / NBRC 103889/ NCYC 2677 / UAMH 7654) TaxID=1186058 RepID=J6ENB5_TRIAS|nr:hypothetical protein A1Q1_05757 [Trichosporon asahii var. asahii CBS 2479]EJT45844.1 hypothetical protein A1Q1_05757 [Trichosporon asahii var. asahii CBS 2479]
MTTAALQRVLNGKPSGSPVQLTAYISEGTKQDKLDVICHALSGVSSGGLPSSLLELKVGESRDTSVVTISWSTAAWGHNVDMARSLDDIRQVLISKDINVAWANSSGWDRRRAGVFTVVPTVRIAAPEAHAVRAVLDFCICHGLHIIHHEVETMRTGIRVKATFAEPPGLLQQQVTDSSDYFAMHSVLVSFTPSAPVVDIKYPSLIASPHRRHLSDADLLQELDGWVNAFNEMHGADESLWDVEDGKRLGRVHDHVAVAIPSSVGLAEFIQRQLPSEGQPYELAFHLNDGKLEPKIIRKTVRNMGKAAFQNVSRLPDSCPESAIDLEVKILSVAAEIMELELQAKHFRSQRRQASIWSDSAEAALARTLTAQAEVADNARVRTVEQMSVLRHRLDSLLTQYSGSPEVAAAAQSALSIDLSDL